MSSVVTPALCMGPADDILTGEAGTPLQRCLLRHRLDAASDSAFCAQPLCAPCSPLPVPSPPPSSCQAAEGKAYAGYDAAKDAAASRYDAALQSAYSSWETTKDKSGQTWDAARDAFNRNWRSASGNWDDAMSSAWEQWQVGCRGAALGQRQRKQSDRLPRLHSRWLKSAACVAGRPMAALDGRWSDPSRL
jgi:hypothetical protein